MLNRWLPLAAASALVALGCSPPCETSDSEPVRYEGGTKQAGIYESSPWEGPYLHFPGGRRYQLIHQLGFTPALVVSYVAYSKHPFKDGNTSENAGNQGVIEAVDSEMIQIRNDTCAEFYLRVVASGTAGSGVGDAGSD